MKMDADWHDNHLVKMHNTTCYGNDKLLRHYIHVLLYYLHHIYIIGAEPNVSIGIFGVCGDRMWHFGYDYGNLTTTSMVDCLPDTESVKEDQDERDNWIKDWMRNLQVCIRNHARTWVLDQLIEQWRPTMKLQTMINKSSDDLLFFLSSTLSLGNMGSGSPYSWLLASIPIDPGWFTIITMTLSTKQHAWSLTQYHFNQWMRYSIQQISNKRWIAGIEWSHAIRMYKAYLHHLTTWLWTIFLTNISCMIWLQEILFMLLPKDKVKVCDTMNKSFELTLADILALMLWWC